MSNLKLGRWTQIIGILLMIFGIVFEVLSGAHLGYIIITAGSLFFAVGTKIHYWKGVRR